MKRASLLCVIFALAAACSSTNNYYVTGDPVLPDAAASSDAGNTTHTPDSAATDAATFTPDAVTGVSGLNVACSVPYILNGSKVSDQTYLVSHFSHLVQQYCVTGIVRGVDIAADPEKMFYGTHATNNLGLTQTAMKQGLAPTYSVKFEFVPDSAAKTGSVWNVGVAEDGETARVAVYKYVSATSVCLFAIGTGGKLTFGASQNTTAEGGSFVVNGNVSVSEPKDVPSVCDEAAGTAAPCCL